MASLEPCFLVTGQLAGLREDDPGLRQAVLTWENDPQQPLNRVPLFRRALRMRASADLFACLTRSAGDHLRVLGVPSTRIEVVLPGIDLDAF